MNEENNSVNGGPESGDGSEQDRKEGRRGLFGRLGASFQGAVQNSRGFEQDASVAGPVEDLASRRPKDGAPRRMVVPDGVTISGSVSAGSEADINGRVEGDVTVESRLYVGAAGVVTGNVRAASCKIEGLVEGKVECSQELEVTKTGRLNSDAAAGRKVTVAGQVYGAVSTGGAVRIVNSGKIEGNIQAKQIFIEEGAKFNGRCTMRPPAERRAAAK